MLVFVKIDTLILFFSFTKSHLKFGLFAASVQSVCTEMSRIENIILFVAKK